MNVFPGASAVQVLLLGGGCGGMLRAGGVSLVFHKRVSYSRGCFFLGEVGSLGFAPFETESAPEYILPPYCVLFLHGFLD